MSDENNFFIFLNMSKYLLLGNFHLLELLFPRTNNWQIHFGANFKINKLENIKNFVIG